MADSPRLYRVILQVSDLDKGAEFYSKLLGTEGRRIRGGFRHYFDCGDVILALVDPSVDDDEARRPGRARGFQAGFARTVPGGSASCSGELIRSRRKQLLNAWRACLK